MSSRSPHRKTLAWLAAELGVSATTVSNAYNRPDQLAPATRERILRAAQELGYAGPDPTARNLRTRHAGTVGVLLTEHLSYAFEDLASVDFLAGMAESTESSLTLIPAGPDAAARPGKIADMVGGAAVDGFVVYSVAAGDPYLEAARARNLPLVVCDQPKDTGAPFVGIDDHLAIQPAAQALVAAGHRRIGILAIRLFRQRRDGPVSVPQLADAPLHVQRARVQGALEVFGAAGIGEVPIITRHLNTPETARAAAAQLLDAHPDITAVLCTTDSMALGVLALAQERGWDVPGDLSVTGFDGIAPALARGLSTVVQPNKDKGVAAGRMLSQFIATGSPVPSQQLETTFMLGTTLGPPR
ncbi:LacI family DNA-binding transcriptional regulator [Corynebacterium lizhenjunii]|uniref:LacI family DNA-binding transcriptional regulator n=1 Tax=Corynebacterium lizhenjunii TaxID=2709394 RepID=A0A7T0KF48_9CORY|nr:LacI family DNA-binding transcriptional regulator [Corynebacterium lizhenjunii]QPK79477.1 LacI family DNA-binding transcriptional regulator [Corynebacterium lizhenjunii]